MTDPDSKAQTGLILRALDNQVLTLTMNMPRRLNGWTADMMAALTDALSDAATADDVSAVILTGADPYYCAGVNLGATLKLGHPRTLHGLIVEHNRALFDTFIDFPKPILAAVNGPSIGAATTSATLCDGIIASDNASFSTPFAKLGVCPEGCSSILFERLMGKDNAERMLGAEGWVPMAAEALDVGLVQWVAPHEQLLTEAQAICEKWIADGKTRTYRANSTRDELKDVNAVESKNIADCFLATPFLKNQFKFLWTKKKRGPALMFLTLWASRPLWGRMLPK